jgi:hypothetical protein
MQHALKGCLQLKNGRAGPGCAHPKRGQLQRGACAKGKGSQTASWARAVWIKLFTAIELTLQVEGITQLAELILRKQPALLPEFLPEMAQLQVC